MEPILSKPGAGLPLIETFIARYLILPRQSRKTSWEQSVEKFSKEGERILSNISHLSAEHLGKPVLIDRIQGIEDSSRHWSVAMTIEHLMIVGTGMTEIILELSHHRRPPIEVDIAKVKPRKQLSGKDASIVFRDFLQKNSNRLLTEAGDRRSTMTHTHPWFKELTAHQWIWLLGVHQSIHRKQISAIMRSLLA